MARPQFTPSQNHLPSPHFESGIQEDILETMCLNFSPSLENLFPFENSHQIPVGLGDFHKVQIAARLLCEHQDKPLALSGRLIETAESFDINPVSHPASIADTSCQPLQWHLFLDENARSGDFLFPHDPLHPIPYSNRPYADPLFQAKVEDSKNLNECNFILVQGHGKLNNVPDPDFDTLKKLPAGKIIWLNACNQVADPANHLQSCYQHRLSNEKAMELTRLGQICIAPAFEIPLWVLPVINQHLLRTLRMTGGSGFLSQCFPTVLRQIHLSVFPRGEWDFPRCFDEIQRYKHETKVTLSDFFAHLSLGAYAKRDFLTPRLDEDLPDLAAQEISEIGKALSKAQIKKKQKSCIVIPTKGDGELLKNIANVLRDGQIRLWSRGLNKDKACVLLTLPCFLGNMHLGFDEEEIARQLGHCLKGVIQRFEAKAIEVHILSKVGGDSVHDEAFLHWCELWESILENFLGDHQFFHHRAVLDGTGLMNLKNATIFGFDRGHYQAWKDQNSDLVSSLQSLESNTFEAIALYWYLFYELGLSFTQLSPAKSDFNPIFARRLPDVHEFEEGT